MSAETTDPATPDQAHYGMHLTLRLSEIENEAALWSTDTVAAFLSTLVARLDFTVLAGPLTTGVDEPVQDAGVSGVVILYESHAAIHTYAAARSAFLDVFGCRAFDPERVKDVLREHFGRFTPSEQNVSDRGLEWSKHIKAEMNRWNKAR